MSRLWMGEVVFSPVAACCNPRARREQPRGRRGVQVLEELSLGTPVDYRAPRSAPRTTTIKRGTLLTRCLPARTR